MLAGFFIGRINRKDVEVAAQKNGATGHRAELSAQLAAVKKISPTTHRGQRIARDLDVSQALVSMVLNGKRQNINPDSYQRIWDHALKIGYRLREVT